MRIAITGHRPSKFNNDYDLTSPLILRIKEKLQGIIDEKKPTIIISGMALGIDTLWAKLAMENSIPLFAVIPCVGQEKVWPEKSRIVYNMLLQYASNKQVMQQKYTSSCMQERNIRMVDMCDLLIGVWDGTSGGTGNCMKYAKSIKKDIIIINPKTV